MKKIFLLFFILFGSLNGCEIGSGYDKRLFSKDIKVVQEAINEGADVNAKNNFGHTPLITAAFNENLEIVKLLIGSGANLNAKDNDEQTALMVAALTNAEVAKLLIYSGADFNIKNKHGYTALMFAELRNKDEVIKLIKERTKLESEFIKAAQEGRVKELIKLIGQKININARDEFGFTALMRAAQGSNDPEQAKSKLEILQILLTMGANPAFKDNTMKFTALQWAQESKNQKGENLLKAAGIIE